METKDTSFFEPEKQLNLAGKSLDLNIPRLMGILNLSPDSFYNAGDLSQEALLKRAAEMVAAGADILDLGGMSSRPGALPVSESEELDRVLPAVELIAAEFPDLPLSVDTYRAAVARQAAAAGAAMINDISAGSMDDQLLDTVASLKLPYVLMHMQGTPENMQQDPKYENVTDEVLDFFKTKINLLLSKGIEEIILDPGFGFGKTVEHNYELLRNLDKFKILGLPLLVGISRKSMICKVLKIKPEDALNGTTALHCIALLGGAKILRVHDVMEAKQLIDLIEAYRGSRNAAV